VGNPVSKCNEELLEQSTGLVKAIFKLLFEQAQAKEDRQREETFKLQKKIKELTNENMKLQLQLKNRKSFIPPKTTL